MELNIRKKLKRLRAENKSPEERERDLVDVDSMINSFLVQFKAVDEKIRQSKVDLANFKIEVPPIVVRKSATLNEVFEKILENYKYIADLISLQNDFIANAPWIGLEIKEQLILGIGKITNETNQATRALDTVNSRVKQQLIELRQAA